MPIYPDVLSSKFPRIQESIFSEMGKMSLEHNAVNLSQGFPNFDCDRELVKLVNHYMKKGLNQYAPMGGVMALRERIAEKTEKRYGTSYDPDLEITVTCGATQAIYTAITSVVREGDEVVVFTPAYDSYIPVIEQVGGKPVFVELKLPNYTIDWSEVKKVVNRKTRMIIINSPHNPTGSVLAKSDLEELQKLTKNSSILILSDEVYEHIVFDEKEHISVASYPELANRSFVVSSFGKTFHATGWKLGYCLAPKELMKEFRKVHQFHVFSVNTPTQYAIADYLADESKYLGLGEFYQEKRDYFLYLIHQSRFKIMPCKGTYFQLLNYSEITEENDYDFSKRLIVESKLATIPISVFYPKKVDNHMLRFCFAKDNETLEKAAEIICKI